MQVGHLKEVVQNISDGTHLEFQLQRCQEDQGVVVLDIYNTEWSSCKALGETFKRLYTDFGSEISIHFFSVECDTIMKKMDNSLVEKKKIPHRTIEYYEDTKSSFWGPILQSRCGHSKPYFILYKEGRMRNQIQGVDTPNICKIISGLCKPDPITQSLTNPDGLKFWKEHFPVTKDEIPFTSFIEAVEKALGLTLTPHKILTLKDAIGVENGICTAMGLQAWLKDSMTLSERLGEIVGSPDNAIFDKEGRDVKDVDDVANNQTDLSYPNEMENEPNEETENQADVSQSNEMENEPNEETENQADVSQSNEMENEPNEETENQADVSQSNEMENEPNEETEGTSEIRKMEVSPRESPISSSHVKDENEHEEKSQTVEKDYSSKDNLMMGAEPPVDPEGSSAAMASEQAQMEGNESHNQVTPEGSIATADKPQNPDEKNQIFLDRWITVSKDELIVWNKISDLPLHYPPPRTALLDTTCEEAAQNACELISHAKEIPTLAGYLQQCGLTDVQINMMCLAAHQKVGSEIPSYGKLALILMTSHRDELTGLLPEPAELVMELAKGTLLGTHGPLGFSALCLCASEVFPDEAFFYAPPPPLGDQLNQLDVGNELPLPALTPLQTTNFPEDFLSIKIVGLPKVIELASTNETEYTVVLSQWFAKLRIVSKTETVVTAQFVELLFEKEYMDFSDTYVKQLMQDENKLNKNLGDKNTIDMEKSSE
ncbi:unnamed protein product [Phytomonas sp. Hart1]|nr:unnamed protein product [Phytomonas sp. Hart1]|eukprot:CCW69314.1 unnamed protein product [Phytomonas sp. isolate Hart1]